MPSKVALAGLRSFHSISTTSRSILPSTVGVGIAGVVAYPERSRPATTPAFGSAARIRRFFHVHGVEDAVARVVGIEQEVGEAGGEVALEGELRKKAGPPAEPVEIEIGGELLRLLVEDVERAVEIVDEEAPAAGLLAHEVDPGQLPSRVLPVQLARDRQLCIVFELERQPWLRLRRERMDDRHRRDGRGQNDPSLFIAWSRSSHSTPPVAPGA